MENTEYTVTPVDAFPPLSAEELSKELESLRKAYSFVDANRTELAQKMKRFRNDMDKFIKSLVQDELVEKDDDCVGHIQEWIDNGTLLNPFTTEYTFDVEVTTVQRYTITVEAIGMPIDDVSEIVESAFADVDGDGNEIDLNPHEDLEITYVSEGRDTIDIVVEER